MKKTKSMGNAFFLLMGITLVEKVLSFLYQTIIAARLGASAVTDSYFTSAEFFTMIDAAVFGALISVLLTQYSNTVSEQGEDAAHGQVSNVLSIMCLGMTAVGILIFIFAEGIGFILAPGFSGSEQGVLVRCIRMFAFVPVAVAYFSVHQVVLRYQKRFAAVSLKSLFISVFGILAVLLFANAESRNADALCIGYLLSIVSYCIFTRAAAGVRGKIGFCRPGLTPDVKKLFGLMLPVIVGSGVTRVALMVDKIIASMFGDGAVSCLAYAQTLNSFVAAFFITNICTILLTDFVNLVAQKDLESMKARISKTVSLLLLLLVPITVLTVLYHREIVSIVFERGSFGSEDVKVAAGLLMCYAFGFIPTFLQNIYLHVYYAFSDTVTTMRVGLFAVVCNFAVSIGLAYLIGINGIAIGTVISTIISVILLAKRLQRHLPEFRLFEDKQSLVRMGIAGVSCVGAAYLIQSRLQLLALYSFGLATIVGGGIFFAVLFALGEPALKEILGEVRRRIRG